VVSATGRLRRRGAGGVPLSGRVGRGGDQGGWGPGVGGRRGQRSRRPRRACHNRSADRSTDGAPAPGATAAPSPA
jgi:hypothetical protein